ncbi:MAG: chorismate-binding protein [Muribaculaceae bacterium]|nr:chorismate-binding protein [Muribaculaceae bacterium]
MNKDITGKVVSARILKIKSDINPRNVFLRLLSTFEDAYIFCFYTPQTGMWLGATPELLLKSDKGIYLTMALAGTRNVGVSDKWDNKNIEEQRLVKEYIAKCLDKTGYNIIIGEQYTKRAGKIEHICNDIYAYPQQKRKLEPKEIETLLKELSPTPALGGFPKEFALNMIKRTENFNRAYYGGFMGYVKDTETFSLYVNLRSGNVSQKELILFAGGGITLDSVPEKEWDETERKLSTLGEILSVIQK